jgi:segregation and condensation protein B
VSAEDPTEPPDVPPDPDAAAEAPTDAPTAAPEPADDLPEGPAELEASERSAEPADDLPQEPAELEASERSAEPATDLPQEPAEQEASELPADPPDPEPDPDAELIDLADIDPDDPLAAMLAELDAPRRPAPAGVQLSEELPIDPEDDLRGVEGEASLRLVSILESLLFAAARPLKVQDLRRILAETSKHQIQLALAHLMAITKDRGVMLAQVAGGFQFRTHPDNAVWVQKMLQTKPARLSRTQIETLAIVAYRQPITRPEIDDVRGVDSGGRLEGPARARAGSDRRQEGGARSSAPLRHHD